MIPDILLAAKPLTLRQDALERTLFSLFHDISGIHVCILLHVRVCERLWDGSINQLERLLGVVLTVRSVVCLFCMARKNECVHVCYNKTTEQKLLQLLLGQV